MLTFLPVRAVAQSPDRPDSTGSPDASVESLNQHPSHVVQEGDNLWNLARRYRTSVEELMEINGLDDNRLQLDQVLLLPGSAAALRSARTASKTHTVRQGDNLWELSRRYHTSVGELLELNHMPNDRLRLGQILQIPEPPQAVLPGFLKQRQAAANSKVVPNPPGVQALALHDTSDALSAQPAVATDTVDTPEPDAPATPSRPLSLREQLVMTGFNFLGVRYRWNGTSETRGFDCSGLVQRLYSLFSIEVPRSSREQFKVGERIARAALEIGDLVFFSSRGGKIPSHVGIYVGADQFLHAASRGKQVMISKLTEEWYSRRFIGARRISDLWKDESRAAEGKGN